MSQASASLFPSMALATNMDALFDFPVTSGLTGLLLPVFNDKFGNSISASADIITRLTTNFAPGSTDGTLAATFSLVGSPDTSPLSYVNCSKTAYVNSGLSESQSFSFLSIAKSTSTEVNPDTSPLIGNYKVASPVPSSAQMWLSAATSVEVQITNLTSILGTATVSISAGVATITDASADTIVASTTHMVGAGLPYDLVLGTQISGTTGGNGTYTISDTTVSVSGIAIQFGAISKNPTILTGLPNVTAWRAYAAIVTAGVSVYIKEYVSGLTTTSTAAAILLPRTMPSKNNLLIGGNSALTGNVGIGPQAIFNRAISTTECDAAMAALMKPMQNRGLM